MQFIFNDLVCVSAAYLGSLDDLECTELALHEYRTSTNMTDQFGALAAITQNPGKNRDEVLADFYNKWQHDFLVSAELSYHRESGLRFILCIVGS